MTCENAYHENDSAMANPRCWCCWESTTTAEDPLIRACLGCKDPQLQFVHRRCIHRFLLHLLRARYPGGWIHDEDFEEEEGEEGNRNNNLMAALAGRGSGVGRMPYLAGESIQLIRQQMALMNGQQPQTQSGRSIVQIVRRMLNGGQDLMMNDEEPLLLPQEEVADSPQALDSNHEQPHKHQCKHDCQKTHGKNLDQNWEDLTALGVRCTRCLDSYEIHVRPVSSFIVLTYDRVLRLLMILMTISIAVLVGACSLIIYEAGQFASSQWAQGQDPTQALQIRTVFLLGGLVDIRQWAVGMITLFGLLYAGTWTVVLRHCGGYHELRVLGKLASTTA